ncbi:hypothetical protein FSB78_11600 [Sphingomonas ginsenosidivorax]|uniref:Uncharacterized protein n=1 Tax=Sphingomonas ginsenosidivorax TaxID=862135 RepID=A0A5C6UHI7_9SPHN|nr:hypothetical protein FSB78_11600 [Sphingomonas ginsenosidivorax]
MVAVGGIGVPGRGGAGAALGAGVGAGAGAGASPNPGGRIDSGLSCPIAGASAASPPTATPALTRAAASESLGKVRKRHGLFDAGLRTLGRATGEQEQPTHDHDEDDDDRKKQAGHGGP